MGEHSAEELVKAYGDVEALQYLVRSVSATGSEDGICWEDEAIHEGIEM